MRMIVGDRGLGHGKTANGKTTSLDRTLASADLTREQLSHTQPKRKEPSFQHGTEEDRKAMDRVAGRQTLDQIEAEGAAERIAPHQVMTAEAMALPTAP